MLKTCLLLETNGERRVLAQKLYRRLARYAEILKPPPSNKPGTRFLHTKKKLLWRKADYLES